MQNHLIFWPVLAQMAIPIIVIMLNGKRKAADVKAGVANPEKSALDNTAWTVPVIKTSRNLANQFQFPVIFYGLCFILATIGAADMPVLIVAWAFVASRVVHAYVHVTSNYVPLRLRAFVVSMLLLLILFVMTMIALIRI